MELSSFPIIGIALAVLSAALLTVGNHLQSVGVERAKGESTSGLGAAGFWALARTPVWLLGSVLFGLAILAQLTALAFAPLIVVQPVGVIALVFASALTAVVRSMPVVVNSRVKITDRVIYTPTNPHTACSTRSLTTCLPKRSANTPLG